MKRLLMISSMATAACLLSGCGTMNEEKSEAREQPLPEFNSIVLKTARAYPADGTHRYWWPKKGEPQYDGGTEDVTVAGRLLMRGEPERRTFCCGLTLEVFVRAYEQWLERHDVTPSPALGEDWDEFKRNWFVLEVNGPGPSLALEKAGLGRTIEPEEALPGDFVQLWRRNGSGHSVIFLDWVREKDGLIKGFRYWSTQPGTEGISENVEYFGDREGEKDVAWEHTYWARVDLGRK